MANIKVMIDGKEYTESQFKKDIARMFDSYRYDDSEHMGENGCKDVVCNNCPLDEKSCGAVKKFKSFDTIKIIYEWAKAHPIIRNRDMLIKTFGDDVLKYIDVEAYKDRWMFKEYKKPKGEDENDD